METTSLTEPENTLAAEKVLALQAQFGTPTFVYDQQRLENQARQALAFPNAFGLTARYAMKACPSAGVVRLLNRMGLHIDASSGYEARRAIKAGVAPHEIQLTAQQLPDDLDELIKQGVLFNACSAHQLDHYGRRFPGRQLSIRVNPGLGSGHSNRTNVGGPSSSFGIWHEQLDQIQASAAAHNLQITGLHSHIGSGSDLAVWQRCARMTLNIAAQLPQVERVSLGGGFKVGRMAGEVSTDLQAAGAPIPEEFIRFQRQHGRQLHLEIEPGTFFVANAGYLICSVMDVVDTGANGYRFIKVDAGMTEVLRPSLYGAQHPITLVPASAEKRGEADYLVVGHCCESGDILTPEPDNPEGLLPRRLIQAQIGDAVCIGGSGAYCAGMAAKNYNSFPEASEVLLATDGTFHLLRRRQNLKQVLANEVMPDILA
jgi:diaminopimelate decarboxylase